MEPISDLQQQRPVSVIPMKRSLSTENDANVDQSPGPGAHHATPVHNMGTPEPPVSSSGKHVKTKQPKERVSHREGGREKKESWKKKEAQGTPAGTPAVSNIKTSHTPDPTVATEGPPGLQRFPLPPTKDADYLPAKPPILVPITYMKDTEIQYCETTDQYVLLMGITFHAFLSCQFLNWFATNSVLFSLQSRQSQGVSIYSM